MSIEAASPDFSDWPPHNVMKGKSIHNIIKVYLRAKVDAEWRAIVLGDSTYLDWFLPEYSLENAIEYLVLAHHVEKERVDKWERCIRERYEWPEKA